MIFGPTPLAEARGAVLAHTLRLPSRVLKKGTVLDEPALAALREAGQREVDRRAAGGRRRAGGRSRAPHRRRHDGAAPRALPRLDGAGEPAGRVGGLFTVDAALVDQVNAVDEAITVATLAANTVVAPRDMLATIKIIPFAVPGRVVQVAEALLRARPAVALRPFRPLKVGLVLTELPGLKESIMEGAVEATAAAGRGACSARSSRPSACPTLKARWPMRSRASAAPGRNCCSSPAPRPWWTGATSGRRASCAQAAWSSTSACLWIRATCSASGASATSRLWCCRAARAARS
jgi:hypothetical protein